MGNQAPDYCFQTVENTKIETERKWGDLKLISQKSEDVKQREYVRRAIQ